MKNARKKRVRAPETGIMIVIGLADLVSTIVFIQRHGAEEANPIFHHYWEMGIGAFVVAKLICLVGPLLVMEWARQRHPRFVAGALRVAIAGYLIMYCVGVFHLNQRAQADARVVAAATGSPYSAPISAQMALELQRYVLQAAHYPWSTHHHWHASSSFHGHSLRRFHPTSRTGASD